MEKMLYMAAVLVMLFILAACGGNNNCLTNSSEVEEKDISSSNEQIGITTEASDESSQDATTDNDSLEVNSQDAITDNDSVEDARIKLTFVDEEVIVHMYDNPTSRDFLGRLPLRLTFKEYGGFEKLSILDKGLSMEDAPAGNTPSTGDFGYYSPWKDVNIYYTDWSYSPGLVLLGKIETEMDELADKLASMSDDFEVTIELMD